MGREIGSLHITPKGHKGNEMKADRFTNLRIVEKISFKSHNYWLVASDTDTWEVSDHGYYQSVRFTTPRSNGGSHNRSVTLTPQGQTILAFVQQEVTA